MGTQSWFARPWATCSLHGWAAVAAVVVLTGHSAAGHAQSRDVPRVVDDFSALRLAGDWYEVAGTGSWSARRCVSDTRYSFQAKGAALAAARACTTALGVERRHGLAKGDGSGTGALKLRLVWPLFAPLPAAWNDFWILAAGAGDQWLLVGDRERARLSLLSRTVALDESAFARAIAAARSAGYSVDGLARVAHPAGATGLSAAR